MKLNGKPSILIWSIAAALFGAALGLCTHFGFSMGAAGQILTDKRLIASLDPQIEELEEQHRDYIDRLRRAYPLFAATRYPEPLNLKQASLRDDEWILAYDATDTGVIIYLSEGKQLRKAVFRPIPRKSLEKLVRRFRDPLEVDETNCDVKLMSFDFATGRKLADLLLSDVLDYLPAGRPVVVVPDESLGVLPFEALVLSGTGRISTSTDIPCAVHAEFFGDRNPVSYFQSITALTFARTYRKKQESGERLLVVADPVFEAGDKRAEGPVQLIRLAGEETALYQYLMAAMAGGRLGKVTFKRLPLTGKLAESLGNLYEGRADIYTGLHARKTEFLNTVAPKLQQYSGIVFATHGYFGKDIPGIMEPTLVLTLVPPGTDGYLRMSEVMELRMNADIVVLTACHTGLGRRISGEGIMGMGRAFQYAGATSVLISLWSVAQDSSVRLVESFLRHTRDGKTKLEALRLARREIRQAGFDHPFFWAPFILVGEID